MFESLRDFIILSIQEIMQFKNQIATHHQELPSAKRAELLSIAIHTHLDGHLTGIDSDYRTLLKYRLLSSTVAKHNYTISQHDVLSSIVELDLDTQVKTDMAQKWLKTSTTINFTPEGLENYFKPNSETKTLSSDHSMYWGLLVLIVLMFSIVCVALLPSPQITEEPIISRTYLENRPFSLYALDRVYLFSEIYKSDLGHFVITYKTVPFGLKQASFPFPYQSFDYFAVKNYIASKRNGLIGSSIQYNTIITLAQINDVDPLLLFAIIGQEQAFVPSGSYRADEVLNNPFNVFNSWLAFNTSLNESTQIAINTIKNRLKTQPLDTSPYVWLNGIYAEDTNWHIGVRLIYQHLESIGRENLQNVE